VWRDGRPPVPDEDAAAAAAAGSAVPAGGNGLTAMANRSPSTVLERYIKGDGKEGERARGRA
jgi:hypothetical protein